ncbi:MAG: hypothetical protein MI863_21495 [Desulfobacterales bacterium]|nr:hypothetical protein [Desulfobacterales bacterium]
MKTLGVLFVGIFTGALVYEVVQRAYPEIVADLRKKTGPMVDDVLGRPEDKENIGAPLGRKA